MVFIKARIGMLLANYTASTWRERKGGGSVILQAKLGFDTKCAQGFPFYLKLNKIVFHLIIVWSLLK